MSFSVARLVPREKRTKRKESEVTAIRVRPEVMEAVKQLPGYDPRNLRIISETEVYLVNRK